MHMIVNSIVTFHQIFALNFDFPETESNPRISYNKIYKLYVVVLADIRTPF